MDTILPYLPTLLSYSKINLSLGPLSLLLAMFLGGFAAWAKMSQSRLVQGAVTAYIVVVRGVPDIVMLLLLYYGVQGAVNNFGEFSGFYERLHINAYMAGVLVLGFVYGAYLTETFRGAALAIAKGQGQAATALGLKPLQKLRWVIFPQFLRHMLPGLANVWQVLVKSTAIISVISLQDLVWFANSAGKSTRDPVPFFLFVILFYLFITSLSGWLFDRLEKRFSFPE